MVKYIVVFITAVVQLLSIKEGLARPNGAPTSACPDLTPGHGVALTGVNPFSIDIQTQSGRINVTISSTDDRPFEGFILQAREIGSTIPVGEFVDLPLHTKVIKCTSDGVS
jgi:hypothetical protein